MSPSAAPPGGTLWVKHLLDPDAPPELRLVPLLLFYGLLDAPDPVPDPHPGLCIDQYEFRHIDHPSMHGVGSAGLGRFASVLMPASAARALYGAPAGCCVFWLTPYVKGMSLPDTSGRMSWVCEGIFWNQGKNLSPGTSFPPSGDLSFLNRSIVNTVGKNSRRNRKPRAATCDFAALSARWQQGSRTPAGGDATRRSSWSPGSHPGAGNPALRAISHHEVGCGGAKGMHCWRVGTPVRLPGASGKCPSPRSIPASTLSPAR